MESILLGGTVQGHISSFGSKLRGISLLGTTAYDYVC
jgi:hypothetical protein